MSATTVVTGIGALAATGTGTEELWRAVREGRQGIGPITRFDPSGYPVRLAGEIADFDPARWVDSRVVVQTDLWTHFALAATSMALEDAGLDPAALDDPYSVGVTTASSSGGNLFGQREIHALWSKGPRHVGPYQSIAWFYAACTGQMSIAHGIKGPCGVVATESAGGLDALAHSRRAVRRGTAAMVTGGTEAPVGPYVLVCQLTGGMLSRVADPAVAYLPFTPAAAGYLPGEGGAVVVLEDARHARDRGAEPVAVVSGWGSTFAGRVPAGADDRQGWARTAAPLARAVTVALDDARLDPTDVDLVFADAIGLPEADAAEAEALYRALGPRAATVPVVAPKTGFGRLYAGSAALDSALAALALRDGVAPTAPGLPRPDPALGLDVVTGDSRSVAARHALVLARGVGGFASALVLSRP
ncbi:beta-ketoacyl synthase N-terminal-like domain-containing protein [Micromonospora sp. NPDC049101]|uniref:beta-ketoacyl synthase N-terminal-like domain-containing protein n=1 Tax=Micromonospora sp. NPDC049101 TaxID=3155032 RepID=UPI0033E98CF1